MADVLAEAVVEVEADVDKFNREFKRSLKQAEKDAQASTTEIDKSFKQLTGNLGKEFEQASKDIARQYREQEREAQRVQREIEREAIRVQRSIEAETKRAQKEVERETARVARENEKAQKQFEKEFIASQRVMQKEADEASKRQTEEFRNRVATLRKFVADRFSLTLGVDTSQLGGALATITKIGAALGVLGVGSLAGQATIPIIAQLAIALQDLASSLALLPAIGASAGIVIGTITLGLRGLGDAIKADKTKDLDEALKKLSDNGKKFVLVVRDLKDEFENLGKQVQNALLANFNFEVKKLADVLLPVLTKGFVGVATELNNSAHILAGFIQQASTIKDIERIFTNTRDSVGAFNKSLTPLARALRDIAAVGSDFLPLIAQNFSFAATKFSDAVARARQSGALKEMFINAIQAVKDFLAIIGNIGGIFKSILDNARLIFGDAGFLGFLRNATERLNAFFKSFEGQLALLKFFDNMAKALDVVAPILTNLARLIFETVLPALVQLGTTAAPGINKLIDGLRGGLERAIPGIISFVDALSDIVSALVDTGLLDRLGEFVRVLGTTLGIALRRLAPTLGDFVNVLLAKLIDLVPKILPPLGNFIDALGKLLIAASPVVDLLGDIVSKVGLPTLQRLAEALTPIIKDLAQSLGEQLTPILPDLARGFNDWIEAMKPITGDLISILIDGLKVLVPLLPPLVRSSVELAKAAQPLIKLFADVAQVVSFFIDKLLAIPGAKKFMQDELPTIFALLTGNIVVPLGKVLEAADKVATRLNDSGFFQGFLDSLKILGDTLSVAMDFLARFSTAAASTWNFIGEVVAGSIKFVIDTIATGFQIINAILTAAWEFMKTSWNLLWEFIKTVASTALKILLAIITGNFDAIPGIISDAFGRMRDAATSAFGQLLSAVGDLPRKIINVLSGLGNLLYGVGRDLVQGFIDGIGSMIGALVGQSTTMGRAAVSAAERAINAHSPSREMMGVGEDFGAGFVVGINSMLRKVTEAGADLATQTVKASTSALAPGDNSVYRMNETLNRLTRNGLGPAPAPTTSTNAAATEQAVTVQPEIYVYIGNEEINGHITEIVDERDRRTKRSLTMGARRIV